MRSAHRKFLTYALLAIYGGISLLGHALHWLTPENHHHPHPMVASLSHGPSHALNYCGHHHHGRGDATHNDPRDQTRSLNATDHAAYAHDCDICAFLDQAKNQQPQVASTLISHPLITAVRSLPQRGYSFASHCLHAPRGPPSLA